MRALYKHELDAVIELIEHELEQAISPVISELELASVKRYNATLVSALEKLIEKRNLAYGPKEEVKADFDDYNDR